MKEGSGFAASVRLMEDGEITAELAGLYEQLNATGEEVPSMFKALANVPELALGVTALLKPLMGEGALVGWYKKLIATYVAALNDCESCVSAHRFLPLQRGARAEQVEGVDTGKDTRFESGPFTEKENAGFRYAELLHRWGNAINEQAWAEVSVHFNVAELLELTAVAAAFEMFPRINSALRIPATPPPNLADLNTARPEG